MKIFRYALVKNEKLFIVNVFGIIFLCFGHYAIIF